MAASYCLSFSWLFVSVFSASMVIRSNGWKSISLVLQNSANGQIEILYGDADVSNPTQRILVEHKKSHRWEFYHKENHPQILRCNLNVFAGNSMEVVRFGYVVMFDTEDIFEEAFESETAETGEYEVQVMEEGVFRHNPKTGRWEGIGYLFDIKKR